MSRAAARAIACGAAGGRNAMRRGWSFFRRLAAAVVLGAAAGLCILVSAQRPAPAPPALDAFPAVTPADRLLILAPHEDDEALAAGGLIQRARSVGAKVHVAYLTYGDHNQLAFIVYRKRPWLTPRINRNMGEVRRREAVQAMASLGVDSSGLTFLGYPDNGTLAIWRYHWDDAPPLRSVLTNTVSVPYRDAAAFGKEYKGENIAADVAAVLHAFRPTRVFVSHPADGNPDHRAFYLYLRLALRDLEGRIPPPAVYTYPVHMGLWPRPYGYRPDEWLSFPRRIEAEAGRAVQLVLTPEEVRRKHAAICAYRSQMSGGGRWLSAFARRNELFIRDEPATLPRGPDWSARHEAMADGSTMAYELDEQVGHMRGVSYQEVPGGISVRIELRRRLERALGLSVSLYGYRRGVPFAQMPKIELDRFLGRLRVRDCGRPAAKEGISVAGAEGCVTVTVPWETLGMPECVFAHAGGMIGPKDSSYTGWEEFAVHGGGGPAGPAGGG